MKNCYYLDTAAASDGQATAKTADQFASGEVAYLLNQNDDSDDDVWGQNIGGSTSPVLLSMLSSSTTSSDTAKIYVGYKPGTCTLAYSNDADDSGLATSPTHIFSEETNRCTGCGKYQPATYNETENTYEIANAGQLAWFAALVNGDTSQLEITEAKTSANGKLTADIDLSTVCSASTGSWTPIGNNSNKYTGTVDGNGHTVSNLYIISSSYYVGLFGCIGSGGTVKNLTLTGASVSGSNYVGSICGYNDSGTIESCTASGTVSGSNYVGGICGTNRHPGMIRNCYTDNVTVSGSANASYVGGICGWNYNSTIQNCYNTGEVSGAYSGGVCGCNNIGTIQNCYNTGAVTGSSTSSYAYVGGVCGYSGYGSTIQNCYNTGAVTGSSTSSYACYACVGGVCGYSSYYSTIQNCYNTGEVTGSGTSGSYVGGVCGYSNGGTIKICYYNNTVYTGNAVGYNNGTVNGETVLGKNTSSFESGEVCYLLNGTINDSGTWTACTDPSTAVWRQNLDNGEPEDNIPVLDSTHGAVYLNDENKYSNYPYAVQKISTADELLAFAELVKTNPNAKGEVVANINMTGYSWTPMGTKANPFTGTLYGNGYTISNLRVSSSSSGGYVGLFGCIDSEGTVENVKLKSVSISASGKTGYAGGICGYNNGGTITNCTVTGTVSTCGQSGSSGGVCGYNAGTITSCTSSVKVTASGKSAYAGGISGYNAKAGTVSGCTSSGAVTTSGKSGKAGGICGYNAGKIASCSSTGKIRATGQSGKSGKIYGYNSGKVS